MAGDWIPKDPATIAEIGGALGGAGLLGKFWDNLFAWRTKRLDHAKDLQTIIDDRLKILLEADEKRLAQMSDAIDSQSSKIDRLEGAVQKLVGHIAALEGILRAKSIDFPPRPALELAE